MNRRFDDVVLKIEALAHVLNRVLEVSPMQLWTPLDVARPRFGMVWITSTRGDERSLFFLSALLSALPWHPWSSGYDVSFTR